jgi:diguanylate cyclase (GGDEF)-like protein
MHLQRDAGITPLSVISLCDPMTRLYGRQGFIFAGTHLLRRANPLERWAFLLSLEVNHWKVVNQALGREAGDDLLLQTAALLRAFFRRSAVIGRLGVERFAVLARVRAPSACIALLGQFADASESVTPGAEGLTLSLRGGFSQFDAHDAESIPHLLEDADARMNALAMTPR